jgi:hypothetical protein
MFSAPLGPLSLEKRPVMMILDHSSVPAVVLVVEDEMLLRMRAVDMVEDAPGTRPSSRSALAGAMDQRRPWKNRPGSDRGF